MTRRKTIPSTGSADCATGKPPGGIAASLKTARPASTCSRRTRKPPAPVTPPAHVDAAPTDQAMLIEIAWEACNQLGGIYTVLRSKAPAMTAHWGQRYLLVGPYNEQTAAVEFEPTSLEDPIGQVVAKLQQMGIGAHYGRWVVSGRPRVVLVDYMSVFDQLGDVKYRLWQHHGIATPGDEEMVNNVLAFGEIVRRLLHLLAAQPPGDAHLIAHFHEWMAGACVPELRREHWPGSIVFTTHATTLGRFLAMNDGQFYEHLDRYDALVEARKYLVEAQFRIERAAVHGAHVFTTVSDITADECTRLLDRTPDVLTPNGLNIQRFEVMHEVQNRHRIFKQQVHEFTMGHFFPSYQFDLDKTLYFFTSGRYEYRNKGMDLTIDALARLNARLKESPAGQDGVTVVAFIVTRRPTRSINVGVLESATALRELRDVTRDVTGQLGEGLFHAIAGGMVPDLNTLVPERSRLRMRRLIHAWQRAAPPTIVTHDLVDDATDDVLNHLRACQLFNTADDPVKVIYHPDFISQTSPLFGMEYPQFVRGCHLGVFPSYYEPWGYTPLESIALGVPAITSDLSGFGAYVQQFIPNADQIGLKVLQRRGKSFDESADELADAMLRFCGMSRRDRIAMRYNAEELSAQFDWNSLARFYHEAHALAVDRVKV